LPPPFFAPDFFDDLLEAISSPPSQFDFYCGDNVANNRAAVTNFLIPRIRRAPPRRI
jgi:hypothetical protein